MKIIKFSPWLAGILLILLLVLAFLFLSKSISLAQTSTGQVLLFDDFSDGDYNDWNVQSGNWSILDGSLYATGSGRNLSALIKTGNTEWDNYILEVDERMDQGVDAGIEVRNSGNSYYVFNIRHGTGMYNTPMIAFHKVVNGVSVHSQQIRSIPLTHNVWYHIKIIVNFDNVKMYVNDRLAVDFNDPGTPIKKGNIGFEAWTGDLGAVKLRYDNVKVISLNPPPSPPPVTPFLRLPWDYEAEGLSFNEAALNMSAYFDHEYPLLSVSKSLQEPVAQQQDTLAYNNKKNPISILYSSHDGYDFAKRSKALVNKPVLAAADGTATYLGTCGACGNAILIDHGNGFQTRYYHMQKDGIITSDPNQKVSVIKGQQIGKIGGTGNVTPKGDAGAHIHFMVIEDKNKDGNFNDNIPDGLVDPFGWQSKDPDPWENFTFTLNEKEYTGNKSYYLWDKALSNLDATLTTNGGAFKTERYELNFPPNFTNQNLNLHMEFAPNVKTENNLESVGSSLITWIKDSVGNEISQYQALYELVVDYKAYDLTRFKPESISIYSSKDGVEWFRENTQIDFLNKKASTKLDHMTQFALMGEPIDQIPATTTAILEGEKGEENWYRSNVSVTLQSEDNENGLGVDYTLYKINNEDWLQYTTPLQFTDEGLHTIEFYSVDQEENIEEIKKVEFSIDKNSPEAKIYANQDTLDMTIQGIDQNQTTVQISPPNSNNLQDITIKDLAGNTATLLSRFNNKDKKDDLTIYQIKYNNLDPILQPNNKFMLLFNPLKEKVKTEKQYLEIGTSKLNLQYDFDKGITKITTNQNGIVTEQQVEGFKLLQVETMSGTLNYSY